MRNILTIALTDLRIFFAQRGNLVGLLLIPAALTTILGVLALGGSPNFRVAVLNLDGSALSQQFLDDVAASNSRFELLALEETTQDSLRHSVAEGQYDAAIIMPEGFEAAMQNLQPIEIRYFSRESASSPAVIGQHIEAVVGRWNQAVVAARTGEQVAGTLGMQLDPQAVYQRATDIAAQEPVIYQFRTTEAETQAVGQGFEQSVPGMGSTFVMFTVLAGMSTLIRERQQWTLQRLVMLPLRRYEILGGKILGYFVLGMIQYGVLVIVGLLFGMNFGSDYLALLLVAASFVLAVTALTFALATRVRSEEQAGQLTTLLALSLASLGGAWWPLEIVPDFMKTIGHFSPVAWAMNAFHTLIYYGGTLVDVLPSIGVLVAIAGVLFMIGVLRFRYE